jgi:protein-disulfide isomerase
MLRVNLKSWAAACVLYTLSLNSIYAQESKAAKSPAVATFKGTAITQEDLKAAAARDLERAEIRHLQADAEFTRAKHMAMETALARLIEDKVLEAETAGRGITKEALLEKEVAGKVKEPTMEDLNAHYPPDRLPTAETREKVFARMKEFLKTEKFNKAKSEYVTGLKKKYGVTESLKPLRLKVETAGSPSMGPDEAPVTILEFEDFQCKACGSFEMKLQSLLKLYGNQVRVVYRSFSTDQNPLAGKAAEAAFCAADQGRFRQMQTMLFQMDHLEERDLFGGAGLLNLNVEDFGACLSSGRYAEKVKKDLYAAAGLGVTSAPALFVNGRPILLHNFDEITKVIEEELKGSPHTAAGAADSNKSPGRQTSDILGARK